MVMMTKTVRLMNVKSQMVAVVIPQAILIKIHVGTMDNIVAIMLVMIVVVVAIVVLTKLVVIMNAMITPGSVV